MLQTTAAPIQPHRLVGRQPKVSLVAPVVAIAGCALLMNGVEALAPIQLGAWCQQAELAIAMERFQYLEFVTFVPAWATALGITLASLTKMVRARHDAASDLMLIAYAGAASAALGALLVEIVQHVGAQYCL